MSRNFDASPKKMLEVKMLALEAQFAKPVYNDADYKLKRQTEIALGQVYKKIMQLEVKKEVIKHDQGIVILR